MTLLPFSVALAGIVGWFLLLARPGPEPSSCFRLLVEAVAVQTVIATLIGVALVCFGVFRPVPTLILAAALPLAPLGWLGRSRFRHALRARFASLPDLLPVLVLALLAPIALPRMEPLRMDSDAGVYSNRAIHHLQTGGLRGSIPVRERLQGELLAIFDRDNMLGLEPAGDAAGDRFALYLPGTYVPASDRNHFVFQFFPGWPVLMALWAGVFGIPRMLYALVFVYALDVLLFGLLLERLAPRGFARATTLVLFASSPLLLFFSKYTTSEIFLLFLFLFVIQFFGGESSLRTVLAAAGVLLFVVSHSSTFLYAPLLLLPAMEAWRSADRRLALFLLLAFGALLVGLPLGHFFSPFYLRDIFSICFAFLPVADPATAGLATVAVFYAAGIALSLALLRRASGRLTAIAPAGTERLLPVVMPPALVVVAAWTAWRGYQLGWTDRFAREAGVGAWSLRAEYVGRGWSSLAHLDVVSMVMATSLVGLPFALVLAVVRGREVCADRARAFLLAAVLWTLALYTFFRVDTPFNYYGSRYFLPVLVPATMLLLGGLLGQLRTSRATVALIALVGIAFNVRFDLALYRYPTEIEKLRFVDAVAERVGRDRVLFVREDERVYRLLALLETDLHGIPVVRVARSPGLPPLELVGQYAAQLGLTGAAILAASPPSDGRAFTVLDLPERGFPQRGVVYPTRHLEWSTRYYLYNVCFMGNRSGDGAATRGEMSKVWDERGSTCDDPSLLHGESPGPGSPSGSSPETVSPHADTAAL
jgi:hypothetical protein